VNHESRLTQRPYGVALTTAPAAAAPNRAEQASTDLSAVRLWCGWCPFEPADRPWGPFDGNCGDDSGSGQFMLLTPTEWRVWPELRDLGRHRLSLRRWTKRRSLMQARADLRLAIAPHFDLVVLVVVGGYSSTCDAWACPGTRHRA
jgi:hypothetical protein